MCLINVNELCDALSLKKETTYTKNIIGFATLLGSEIRSIDSISNFEKEEINTPIEYFEKDKSKIDELMRSPPTIALSNAPVWDAETSPMYYAENGCFSLAFGFKICWELDLKKLVAAIILKFNEIELGRWQLDKEHTTVHIGVSVGFAKASLDLTADWIKKQISLKGEICLLGKCKRFDVVLFHWG